MEHEDARIVIGEDEEEEEEGNRVLMVLTLHRAPFPFSQKMNFPEFCNYFGAIAWCGRYNIVACATETCTRDPSSNEQPIFWIPVHVFDPERPSEHCIFNVTADSPSDSVQFLDWSPFSCPLALLVGNTSGRITIWSQPTQGTSNVARAMNSWICEHEWRQGPAVTLKWVKGPSCYQFSSSPPTGASSPKSLEERFLAHAPRSQVRWPSFLCICSIEYSGSVQLHWRQSYSADVGGPLEWYSTKKAVLGAGPSGLCAADMIVNESGSLLVAGAPLGTPATVIVWEVSPLAANSAKGGGQAHKYGVPVQVPSAVSGVPGWPGVSPLAAYLISYAENVGQDTEPGLPSLQDKSKDGGSVALQCTPVSNLSVYIAPEASTLSTWGAGVFEIAFDPSRGGSALITLTCEGYRISPECPESGPVLTGWRFQRWEISSQPVAIHPLFDTGTGTYPTSNSSLTAPSWTSVSKPSTLPARGPRLAQLGNNLVRSNIVQRPVNPKCIAKIVFSSHGGEFALSLVSGEVYVFAGTSLTPIESFVVQSVLSHPLAVAFSPTSCCLASVWHSKRVDRSLVKILALEPSTPSPVAAGSGGPSPWERHLADRFWWSLVSDLDWWDVIACSCFLIGDVTAARLTAVLDSDFHALPSISHRQCYSTESKQMCLVRSSFNVEWEDLVLAVLLREKGKVKDMLPFLALDRMKCRMLEGYEAADMKALVLDMQARLLLDTLGKGIEASLINPSTLVTEPWTVSNDTLSGLGPDAMTVDPALVSTIQAYVDSILDLASHFLTRLRRYASFCRTLSHAASNSSSMNAGRPGAILSNGVPTQPGQGSASQTSSSNSTGTSGVQAWVQGAIAKISSNPESSTSSAPSSGIPTTGPLAITVSSAFPGIPAIRLIGDRHFLQRLCQLLFFCLIFRKRQLPRFVAGPRAPSDSTTATVAGTKGLGANGTKTEDTTATSAGIRPVTSSYPSNVKVEDGTSRALPPATKPDEASNHRPVRVGSGNAGQGYTAEEVKYLFLVLVDLCKKTALQAHPLPKSQVGSTNAVTRLHYIDGQYSVQPEVVEASLTPHMQQLPRPRGADAAGLLMRELELQPPAEDWNRKSSGFGPWSNTSQRDIKPFEEVDRPGYDLLWPRKRRYAERDAAFGLRTAVGMGNFTGFMGSRRDVITGVWKVAQHGVWHKCLRCGRQTASLAVPMLGATSPVTSSGEAWWTARWVFGCPTCGGRWARIHL